MAHHLSHAEVESLLSGAPCPIGRDPIGPQTPLVSKEPADKWRDYQIPVHSIAADPGEPLHVSGSSSTAPKSLQTWNEVLAERLGRTVQQALSKLVSQSVDIRFLMQSDVTESQFHAQRQPSEIVFQLGFAGGDCGFIAWSPSTAGWLVELMLGGVSSGSSCQEGGVAVLSDLDERMLARLTTMLGKEISGDHALLSCSRIADQPMGGRFSIGEALQVAEPTGIKDVFRELRFDGNGRTWPTTFRMALPDRRWQRWVGFGGDRQNSPINVAAPVSNLTVDVRAVLGRLRLSASDVASMDVGDTLLSILSTETLEISDNHPVANGTPALANQRRAFLVRNVVGSPT